MRLSLFALIAPAFVVSLLVSAIAHGETEAEHVAALMAAPMACYSRPSDSTAGGTIRVCVPVRPSTVK